MKDQYFPLSFSSCKAFSQSPAHFVAYKERKQHETPAMRLGTAVHMAVLEPEKFDERYQVLTARRGTKAFKELQEKHPNAQWLTEAEYLDVVELRNAVKAHPKACELFSQCTDFEKELRGQILGLPFRGFADAIAPTFTVDLKTTMKGNPRDFRSDAFRQKYHVQGYIYTRLLSQLLGRDISEHWLITVEKSSPYVVTCYRLSGSYIDRGAKDLEQILERWNKWDGEPVGFDGASPFGFFELDVPSWAV